MLLFRGPHWDRGLSTDELQAAMDKVMAWFEGLNERGKIKGAQPLGGQGRVISGTDGRFVMDGPFTETKEAVGGYLVLQADEPRTRRSRLLGRCRHCVTASALKSGRFSRNVLYSNVTGRSFNGPKSSSGPPPPRDGWDRVKR